MTTTTHPSRSRRSWVRSVAFSAAALGLGLTVVATNSASAAFASSGELTVKGDVGQPLTSGGSTTGFSLSFTGAACPGDSATGGYKVQSFFVADSIDPSTLTYNGLGLVGATKTPPLKWFLSSTTGTAFKNVNTAVTTGLLTNLPLFSFALLTAGDVPAGSYKLGYACTLNGAVVKFWDKTFTFTADGVDPLGVVWGAAATPPTSTTSSTSSTTTSSTTTSSTTTTTTVAIVTPNAPTGVTGTPGDRSVRVNWAAPVANGGPAVSSYVVQKSSNNGATWSTVSGAAPLTRTLLVAGLTNGSAYKFRVAATNTGGTGSYSAASAAVVPRTVPSAPGKPVASPYNTWVSLTWAAPSSNGGAAIKAYRVQRSTNGVTWVTMTSTASATTRTYAATGLKNGTSYRFRVAALNIAGAGAYSAITVSAPKAVPTAPGKPTATASNTKVKLGWAKPAKAGGGAVLSYTVQRSLDGVKWTTATSSAPLTRTYTVTGLTNGKVYHFRVAAKNKYGVGPWSAVTTAKPH